MMLKYFKINFRVAGLKLQEVLGNFEKILLIVSDNLK